MGSATRRGGDCGRKRWEDLQGVQGDREGEGWGCCLPKRLGCQISATISVDHVELQLRTGSGIIALDEEPQFVGVSRRREVGPERIHHDVYGASTGRRGRCA